MQNDSHTSIAWDMFDKAYKGREMSLIGTKLIASMSRDQLAAFIRTSRSYGYRANVPDDLFDDDAEELAKFANDELEGDARSIECQSLIALCAALEYLWKAALVDTLCAHPQVLREWPVSLKLNVADVIGLDDEEKLFIVADLVYQQGVPRRSRGQNQPTFDKYAWLVEEVIGTHESISVEGSEELREFKESIRSTDVEEAFLVRNCFVHSGGHCNKYLSERSGMVVGATIPLNSSNVPRYSAALLLTAMLVREHVMAARLF